MNDLTLDYRHGRTRWTARSTALTVRKDREIDWFHGLFSSDTASLPTNPYSTVDSPHLNNTLDRPAGSC